MVAPGRPRGPRVLLPSVLPSAGFILTVGGMTTLPVSHLLRKDGGGKAGSGLVQSNRLYLHLGGRAGLATLQGGVGRAGWLTGHTGVSQKGSPVTKRIVSPHPRVLP